jgi:hypothetical protein
MGFLGNANEWFEIHPIVIMVWLGTQQQPTLFFLLERGLP